MQLIDLLGDSMRDAVSKATMAVNTTLSACRDSRGMPGKDDSASIEQCAATCGYPRSGPDLLNSRRSYSTRPTVRSNAVLRWYAGKEGIFRVAVTAAG